MQLATVEPSHIALEPEQPMEFAALVATEDQRNTLATISEHYANLLRRSLANIRQIEHLKNVIYVLDTDLIRNVVESRFPSPWMAREAERFLTHPNVAYAIPVGAFLETSHWLRSIFPEHTESPDAILQSVRSGEPKAIARAFAQTFGVSFSERDNTNEIVDRTVRNLDRSNAAAQRLLMILTHDNFRGVVGGQKLDEVQRVFRILSQAPRKPTAHPPDASEDDDRLQKDYHDAINLAIVFRSVRQFHLATPSDRRVTCHILVTNTFVLRNLPRWISAELPDAGRALSEMIGVDTPVVEGLYPVLTPQEAFVVEETRGSGFATSRSFHAVTEQKKAFDGLSDLLRSWESRSSWSLTQFETSLRHLSSVYYSATPFFGELERARSIDFLRRRIEGMQTSASSRDLEKLEALQVQAHAFFKVLQRVQAELRLASTTGYSMAIETLEEDEDFGVSLVQSVRILSSDSQQLVLDGELYAKADGSGPQAFVLRWCTAFPEKHFFEALSGILRVVETATIDRSGQFNVRRLLDISEEWTEGFLLYASEGVFGCTLSQLPSSWRWKDVTRDLLRDAVAAAIDREPGSEVQTDDVKSLPKPRIAIKAARVTTKFGDFQIELDPDSISELPTISVLTNSRIPEHIAFLCERTHPAGILSTKLSDSLRPLTNQFPEFVRGQASA